MNASTSLLRALLARGDYLEAFSREQLRALLPILESAHDEVLGKIAKAGGAWGQLEEIAEDLDAIYQAALQEAYEAMRGGLRKLAVDEGAWVEAEARGIAVGISLSAPSPSFLKALIDLPTNIGGSTLDQLFDALGINIRTAAYDAIRDGMLSGDTVDELTRRLRGKVVRRASWRKVDGRRRYIPGEYEGGALEDVSTREAEALARTAIHHVSNRAREAFYDENEDLIKGYQRYETLDSATCILCGVEDGRFYPAGEPRPMLPAHIGCRGGFVPVLKSWRELGYDADELPPGTRASMDGQVPATTTWTDRLETMSPAARIKVLRPNRARLYEQGMKVEAMVKDGKLLTLKELGVKRGRVA